MTEVSSSRSTAQDRAEVRETWPFFLIIVVMVVVGYATAMQSQPVVQKTPNAILFTVLILLSIGLFVLCPIGVLRGGRAVFVIAQAVVIFAIGLFIPHHWLPLGLYPGLMGMAIGLYWGELRPIIASITLCLVLLGTTLLIAGGWAHLRMILPWIIGSLLFVFIYVVLYMRQLDARQRAQAISQELEEANQQLRSYAERVEELTLSHERERMGRELHDTLAQGLAGLIMQLEAIDSHLENCNSDGARAVVERALARARSSLAEARRAIMALRASTLEHGDLQSAVVAALDDFVATAGVRCERTVSVAGHALEPWETQDLLRIVQECLSNITRHAGATSVVVELEARGRGIMMRIEDDGKGFDMTTVPPGLGLTGLHERAARLDAELQVESAVGGGTTVALHKRGEPA